MKIERLSVGIFLINSKKELLLPLRDNNPEIDYPGHWGIFGGEIEKKETPEKAIKRELKEEIEGVEIKKINLLGKMQVEKGNLNLKNTNLFLFRGLIKIHPDKIKLNEGQKMQFFNLKQLTDLRMVSPLKKFVFENKEKIFN